MKITHLYIREFGKLRGLSLSFSDGLNLIEGENESGKSTVLSFIRFIFYGFPKKAAGENLSEGERYFSWEHGIADGNLSLRYKGHPYRIERRAKAGSARQSLQIIDLETDLPTLKGEVPGLYFLGFPENVFDSSLLVRQSKNSALTGNGISNAIENLLFSGDESISTDKAAKKLIEARRLLRYERGKGGALYESECKKGEYRLRLEQAKENSRRLTHLTERLEVLLSKEKLLEKEGEQLSSLLSLGEVLPILDRFTSLHQKEAELEQCEALEKKLAEEQKKNGKLPNGRYCDALFAASELLLRSERELVQKEAILQMREAAVKQQRLSLEGSGLPRGGKEWYRNALNSQAKPIPSPILLLSLLLSSLLLGTLLGLFLSPYCFLLFLGVIPAGYGWLLSQQRMAAREALAEALSAIGFSFSPKEKDLERVKRDLEAHFAMRDREIEQERALLDRFDTERQTAEADWKSAKQAEAEQKEQALRLLRLHFPSESAASPSLLRSYGDQLRIEATEREKAAFRVSSLRELCDRERAALAGQNEEELRARLRDGSSGNELSREVLAEKRRELEEKTSLLRKIREERPALIRETEQLRAACEDPAAIEAAYEAEEEAYLLLSRKYRAILAALAALDRAAVGLRERLTPHLRKNAAERLSKMTGGKYQSLSLDDSFSISAEVPGEGGGEIRPADAYSGGTKDAMYLSLRLALCDLFGRGESLPLLLDEALCHLDDGRAEGLLSLLLEEKKETFEPRQVLLFTCHKREFSLLQAMGREENRDFHRILL